jgi:four helix bundle protein
MLKNFRAYGLAVEFYKICERVSGAHHLLDQLTRAASSIVLNLAEGSERGSDADRRRFYRMAMGSVRECQAVLDLLPLSPQTEQARTVADKLAAHTFGLCKTLNRSTKTNPPQRTDN